MKKIYALIFVTGWLLCNCENRSHANNTVHVFYATTRKIVNANVTDNTNLEDSFGNSGRIMAVKSFGVPLRHIPLRGIATVVFPKHNKPSTIGSEKYAHIKSFYPKLTTDPPYQGMNSDNEFYKRINMSIDPKGKFPLICYVHGYNNDFKAAAYRAAVFAADLQPTAQKPEHAYTALIYSWPSAASIFGPIADYPGDEDSSLIDQDQFLGFIKQLNRVRAPTMLIGHSMGCRMLTYALRDIWQLKAGAHQLHGKKPIISELVLIEPDVNQVYFCEQIPKLSQLCGHITIYYNAKDKALWLSEILHNNQKRLGQTGVEYIASRPNVDVIDASALPSNFFHHAYDNAAFFADLQKLGLGIHAAGRVGTTLNKRNETTKTYSFR